MGIEESGPPDSSIRMACGFCALVGTDFTPVFLDHFSIFPLAFIVSFGGNLVILIHLLKVCSLPFRGLPFLLERFSCGFRELFS